MIVIMLYELAFYMKAFRCSVTFIMALARNQIFIRAQPPLHIQLWIMESYAKIYWNLTVKSDSQEHAMKPAR